MVVYSLNSFVNLRLFVKLISIHLNSPTSGNENDDHREPIIPNICLRTMDGGTTINECCECR